MSKTLILRPHQVEAIAHIETEEYGNDLVRMPTGSGKTIVFMQLVHDRLQQGKRSLILVHREHLITQVIERFNEFYPDDPIGIVRGKERQWDSPIVVASILTATNDIEIMPTAYSLVITDECHRAIAPSYFALYQRLGLINEQMFDELISQATEDTIKAEKSAKIKERADEIVGYLDEDDLNRDIIQSQTQQERKSIHSTMQMGKSQREAILKLKDATEGIEPDQQNRKHIGFTATAQRTDELGLGILFTGVAYQCKMKDLVDKNQLCDLRILPVSFRCDTSELRSMLRDGIADDKIVNLWKEHASDRKSTIAFCMNIKHTETLTNQFIEAGIDAAPVHSKLPKEQRQLNEERFRRGELPILANCNVFVEGMDVPRLDCIIMARDTDSATLIPQALGRGTRIENGKQDCLVLDIGKTINLDVLSKETDIFRKIQYVDGQNPSGFDGIRETREGEDHKMFAGAFIELAKMIEESDDSLSWVPYLKIGGQSLNLSRNEWISIGEHRDNPDRYAAAHEKDGVRRLICKSKESIHVCKDESLRWLLDNKKEHLIRSRDAEWRMNKATRTQIAILQKHGIDVTESCTRGEASDLIATALRNT